jgi:guanylate kinase
MNKILVISGPSGSGKDTILEAVCKAHPDFYRAISYTDRDQRQDDKPDTYHFISKEEFDKNLESGEIFEWEYARDQRRYGSSRQEIQKALDEGKNIIKIVGPKSFTNFKNIFGDKVVGIFIKFENLGLLKTRIKKNRPDITEADLETRFAQAHKDMEFEKYYNYSVINPEGHPEIAIREVENIIDKELQA